MKFISYYDGAMKLNHVDFFNKHKSCQYTFKKIPTEVSSFSWITKDNKTPYLPLLVDGPWQEILTEARNVNHLFVPHRNDGHSSGWSSLCLHGLGMQITDAPGAYPEYRDIPYDELPWKWTELADLCPITTEYFQKIFPYKNYQRLRFMKLDAGGYITPHNDGNTFTLSAVNISLNNPIGCNMVLQEIGIVPFNPNGGVMAFNTSYEHSVWNNSNEDRYHMIVHGLWNHKWNKIILESYNQQLIV